METAPCNRVSIIMGKNENPRDFKAFRSSNDLKISGVF